MTRHRHRPQGAPGDEFGELVRRSLHAAAEQVEPNPDGLDRIRDKIRSGPVYASAADRQAGARPRLRGLDVLAGLAWRLSGSRGEHSAPRGHGAPPRPGRAQGRSAGPGHARPARRRPMDWREAMLRPALGIGVAVFAVAVVLAAVPPLRQAFVQVSTDVFAGSSSAPSSPGPGGTGPASSTNQVEGNGTPGILSPSAVPCVTPSQSGASGAAKTSTPSPTRSTASPSAPVSPSVIASPSTDSPSDGGSASPSDTESASASPNGSATGSDSASATSTASASDTASAKASATASSSPHASGSGGSQAATPTPAATCTGQTPTGHASASPSKGATTSPGSAGPSVSPDPSPSTPETSSGSGVNPYGGSPDLSGGSPT